MIIYYAAEGCPIGKLLKITVVISYWMRGSGTTGVTQCDTVYLLCCQENPLNLKIVNFLIIIIRTVLSHVINCAYGKFINIASIWRVANYL